jgi:hypothetical protein
MPAAPAPSVPPGPMVTDPSPACGVAETNVVVPCAVMI